LPGVDHPSLLPLLESGDSPRRTGVRAVELLRACKKGLPVATTWVLDAEPFRVIVEQELPPGHDPYSISKLGRPKARFDRAARARERLLEMPLPDDLSLGLEALVKELRDISPWGLAVRPSPTVDDEDPSVALGIGDAVLAPGGASSLADAIRQAWAAFFLPRSLEALFARKSKEISLALLIQPLLRADASGVLVTRPPTSAVSTTWRRGERLLNVALGLGARPIDGQTAVDVVRVGSKGEVLAILVGEKRERLVVSEGKVVAEAVSADASHVPALSKELLIAVAELADRLEGIAGPSTASFVVVGDQLCLTEVRRGTSPPLPVGGEVDTVWTRGNVSESFPGVVSPLTFELASALAESNFRAAFERLGCSVPRGAHFVGNVHGRAYLNLSALMRVSAQLPGVDPRAGLSVAGAEGIESLDRELAGVSKRSFFARLPATAARLLTEQARLASDVTALDAFVGDAHGAMEELDLAILPDDGLVPTLRDVRSVMDRVSRVQLSATSSYMTSHLLLKTVLSRTFPVTAEQMAQAITSGANELASVRAALDFGDLVTLAREDAALSQRILAGDGSAFTTAEFRARRAFAAFVGEHGDHTHHESELMIPRWREQPERIVRFVAAALRAGLADPRTAMSAVRAESDRVLATLERKMPFLDLTVAKALADRTRKLGELRERARAWLTRVLGMMRRVLLEIDRRIGRVEPSAGPDAAFFCTLDELLIALRTGRPEVAHVAALRRAEHARDLSLPDPPITFLGSPPPVLLAPPGEAVLRGLPASGGAVIGPVRVARDEGEAADLQAGEILVMKSVDLSVVPLFLVAKAIVIELGGPLTHVSAVARELGVPKVAHVAGATLSLRTGDVVRVDGSAGVVERVEAP
jgi:rifampicin phosphotransferase